jgi:hypothetical protein
MDDTALNEYLRRDSVVSQRYRQLDATDVPATLDRAILSQAKAAVADKKISRLRGVTRWSAPLAVAASIVLVVSIMLQPSMQSELAKAPASPTSSADDAFGYAPRKAPAEKQEESTRADRPAPSPQAPVMIIPSRDLSGAHDVDDSGLPLQPQVEKSVLREFEARTRRQSADELQRMQAPQPPAATPPPAAAPAPEQVAVTAMRMQAQQNTQAAPVTIESAAVADESTRAARSKRSEPDLSEVVVTGTSIQPAPSVSAGPRGSVSRARAGFEQSVDKNDPHAWLDYIRELREAGKANRADTEWRRFRTRYPDFVVPDDDSARPPRR